MQVQKFETDHPVMVALEESQFCILSRPRGAANVTTANASW